MFKFANRTFCTLANRTFCTLLVVGSFCLLVASPSFAQSRAGIRAGVSADPEQFYVGGHIDLKEIVKQFWFRPNAELGFGDNRTVVAFNGEFVYRVTTRKEWNPYFGGGPALVITTVRGGGATNTDAGPGFNFVAGIEQRKGLMAEVKVGAMDSPGFKLGVGWTW